MTPVTTCQRDAAHKMWLCELLNINKRWMNSGVGTASFYTFSGKMKVMKVNEGKWICYYLHLAAICLTSPWINLGLEISSVNSRNGTVQDSPVLGILLGVASGPLEAKARQTPVRGNTKCADTSTLEEPEEVAVTLKRNNFCLCQMF